MEFLLTLRRRGIGDAAVLRALDEVPRERFVDAEQTEAAYADQALPIACGQTISQPYVVAYMTEQLGVRPHHRVLEVGTGSGYQAAVLSRLAREVVIDRALPHARQSGAQAARRARLRERRGRRRRRPRRRAGARALRPHHRHRGGRKRAAGFARPARRGRGDGAAARAARRIATDYQAYQVANGRRARGPDRRAFRAAFAGAGERAVTFISMVKDAATIR